MLALYPPVFSSALVVTLSIHSEGRCSPCDGHERHPLFLARRHQQLPAGIDNPQGGELRQSLQRVIRLPAVEPDRSAKYKFRWPFVAQPLEAVYYDVLGWTPNAHALRDSIGV